MISWRAKRQLLVFSLAAAIIGGGIFWMVNKVLPEPSCFDNRQNQRETGVDCGGPCIPCVLKYPKQIEVFWTKAVSVGENVYDAVAFVENPNAILASDKLEYKFTFFDEFGKVGERSGKTFLLAQERTHIVEVNVPTKRAATRVEFTVAAANWMIREDIAPDVSVERREYGIEKIGGKNQSVVRATLMNRETVSYREADVNFLIFDANQNLIAANKTLVDALLAGERREIKAFWPDEIRGDIASIEIEPRVNIFNPNVILKP